MQLIDTDARRAEPTRVAIFGRFPDSDTDTDSVDEQVGLMAMIILTCGTRKSAESRSRTRCKMEVGKPFC